METCATNTLPLDADTWDQLRQLAEAETGMDLSGSRMTRLREALKKIVPATTNRTDLRQSLARTDARARLLERLTGQLTIGESFFFRNDHHFAALREQVVPEILRDNAQQRQIRMWAAGCAGGEEPYSLAILLDMILGKQQDWRISILATDLNPEFLERARGGVFRPWSFRQTDIHHNANYFTRQGDAYHLVPRVKDWVRFAYLNLVKDVYPSPLTGTMGLDLILFRNVAIYLKPEVTRAIIQRFCQALRPGGWLLLGEAEVGQIPTEGFATRRFGQATLHQKLADSRAFSQAPLLSALPVLATVEATPAVSVPGVPTLPDWVPLPARRANPLTVSPPSGRWPPAAGGAAIGQTSVWQQIERCLAQRDFANAERSIDRLPNKPDRASLRLRYVRALMSTADIIHARRALETCLAEEPLSIEAQLLKASLSEEAGELSVAEQACRRALYIDRHCLLAHFHLALVQQQTGDSAGAARSLRTALALVQGKNPHEPVAFGEGVCYGRLREMISLLMVDS
ncbi:MAG: CheR family methyltransferase [Pirellulales bacterium]